MVLLVLVLLYGIETMIWRENERSRIRAVQMDKLRDLLGVRRRDRVPNARTRKLCGVAKRVDGMVDESVLRWFGYIERMANDRIAKRVYVRECVGSRLVDRPRKRWIDSVND